VKNPSLTLISFIISLLFLSCQKEIEFQERNNTNLRSARNQELTLSQEQEPNQTTRFYINHYSNISFCDSIKALDPNSYKDDIFYHLLLAKCGRRQGAYTDTLIYRRLLQAKNIAASYDSKEINSEIYRALLDHSLYTEIDSLRSRVYLDEYKNYVYDELEEIQYDFYAKRLNYIILHNTAPDPRKVFVDYSDLIQRCQEIGHYRLSAELRRLQANQLERKGQLFESIKQNELAIQDAEKVSNRSLRGAQFASGANSSRVLAAMGKHQEAILGYKNALRADSDNQVYRHRAMVYDWLSVSYASINMIDSAYRYERLRNTSNLNSNAEVARASELEISRLYDNKRLRAQRRKDRLVILGISIGAGLLGMLSFGIYYVLNQRRRRLSVELENADLKADMKATRAKIEGEQSERQQIASVLHDQIASHLTAADLQLSTIKEPSNPAALGKAKGLIKDIGVQIRDISHQLVSPSLLKYGLEPAVQTLIEQWENENRTINFQFNSNGTRPNQETEMFIYNATTELLQNVDKHSNATNIDLELKITNELIRLKVKNDFPNESFPNDTSDEGLGLEYLEKRCKSMGGSLAVEQGDSHFSVILRLVRPNLNP